MKSKNLLIVVIGVIAICLTGIFTYSKTEANLTAKVVYSDSTKGDVYTCSMHPDVISDKPGQCPKCGMNLIKKEDNDKDKSMNMKDCMNKCRGMGCNMDKCNGESGACKDCTNDCKNMMKKDEKKMDKDCKSDCMKH
jgi:hypothetical protein